MATPSSAGMVGSGETPEDALVNRVTILRPCLSGASLDPCYCLCLLQPLFSENTCVCGYVCMYVSAREIPQGKICVLLHLPPPFSAFYSSTLVTSLLALPSSQHFSHLLYAVCSSLRFTEILPIFIFSVCSPLISTKTWKWFAHGTNSDTNSSFSVRLLKR